MDRPKVNKLLVEGDEDKRVIPELVERATGLPWGERQQPKLIDIKAADGIERMLARDYIETELKTAGLHALGLILDADDKPAARWQALRDRCLRFCPDFPEEPPPEGLVTLLASRIRFGAWLMPDNQQRGMLETFLATLRPADTQPALWRHVVSAVEAPGSTVRCGWKPTATRHSATLSWPCKIHQAASCIRLSKSASSTPNPPPRSRSSPGFVGCMS